MKKGWYVTALILPNIILQYFLRGAISYYILGSIVGATILTGFASLLTSYLSKITLKNSSQLTRDIVSIILAFILYYGLKILSDSI